MNKCDIGQLKVHDVEVCPLYYQLVPDRLVRSKKSPEALSVAVSTNVGFFSKKFGRVHEGFNLPSTPSDVLIYC